MSDGDIEYDMNQVVGSLIRTLDKCIEPDWKNLEACLANDFVEEICIDNEWSFKDSLFLNFNYTRTLEKLYNIAPDKVLHIHGNVLYSDINDILFGHGDDTPWEGDETYVNEVIVQPIIGVMI